jgi:molecular chaperone DnaK (HSP70)
MRAGAPIEIIIGIDYGTRFTKVAVGREGQEPSVWRGSNATPLIPSIVHITAGGDVLPWPEVAPAGAVKIEYLKMLLAKPHDSIFDLPSSLVAGQKRENVVKALGALFLSEIIVGCARQSKINRT